MGDGRSAGGKGKKRAGAREGKQIFSKLPCFRLAGDDGDREVDQGRGFFPLEKEKLSRSSVLEEDLGAERDK